jgi:hypothetical protein
MTFRTLAILSLAAAASTAHAEPRDQSCSNEVLETVASAFRFKDFKADQDAGSVVASACQLWPLDNKSLLVAMAVDEGAESKKTLLVAVVDSKTGKAGARHRGIIEEDAVMAVNGGSLRIDTARYDLAPGRRAFGVDISSMLSGPRCAEGGLGPTRNLYLPDKTRLLPVLEDLSLSHWTYIQGAETACSGREASKPEEEPVVETTSVSLSVDSATTNGLRDLLVTGMRTIDNTKPRAGKPFRVRLKFDGRKYDASAVMTELIH